MTIEAQTVSYSYVGDGVTVEFPFPSKFLSGADLLVGVNGVLTTSGVTALGAGADTGGRVTVVPAPAAGAVVTIIRKPEPSQLTDFVNGQTVLEGVLDTGLDKLTMLVQYLLYCNQRTVRVSELELNGVGVLPPPASRAQNILGFDAAGGLTTVPALNYVPTSAVAGHAANRASASASSYAAGVSAVYTAGYAAAGDGGEGIYVRTTVAPASGGLRTLDRYLPNGATDAVNGGWWKPAGRVTAAMYGGDADSAAQAAYDNRCAFALATGKATVSVPFGSDGKVNYAALVSYVDWLSSCTVGPTAEVTLRPADGLYPLTVYDVKGNELPAIEWGGGFTLGIDQSAGDFINITGVAFGAAGSAHHPIYRTATQYPVTITLATALPARVDVGFPVWAQGVTGSDPDALLASGALIVEWVAPDRLSFRATIQTAKVGVTSPATIANGGVYQTMSTSVLRVPRAAFLWDTEYQITSTTAVATVATGAVTTVTAVAHGLVNGNLVRFSGSAPPQMLGRTFYVQGATANTFTLRTCNNQDIDSSAYDVYAAGGSVHRVVEAWTGAAQEGVFNATLGTLKFANVGFAWGGWLHGNTGVTADQEFVFGKVGSSIILEEGAVLAGAGDKIVRTYGEASVYANRVALGGGGAQSAVYTQGGARAEFIRSSLANTVTNTAFMSGACSHIYNSCVINGSGAALLRVDEGAAAVAYPCKLYGGLRGVYAGGGRALVAGTTEIAGSGTGLDGFSAGVIVGLPAFSGNVTDSALLQDGVGGVSSGKGGARWVASTTGDQSLPVLQASDVWSVEGVVACSGAGRVTSQQTNETVAFGGASAVHNTPLGQITEGAPTVAAGGSGDITVNNSLVTATSIISVFVVGGTHTAGIPVPVVRTRAAGSFTLRVYNAAAAAFAGGTLILGYKVEN